MDTIWQISLVAMRMPFEISPASEEYQRRQHEVIEGLPSIHNNADDILIIGQGETEENAIRDHDKNMIRLLKGCRKKNRKLNPEKFKLNVSEVPCMGHLSTSSGLTPDPKEVRAVKEMPIPNGVTRGKKMKAVQRFYGFVNYLAKFLPKLSDACEPLRRLTDKDTIWHWKKHHQEAFDRVKKMVINFPVIRYYDVNLPVTIQCDSRDTDLELYSCKKRDQSLLHQEH